MKDDPKRKPPARVVGISGEEYRLDVVTQGELTHAAELQAAVWLAEGSAREVVLDIERRLKAGATVERGALMFDRHLKMARRRGKAEGSG